MPRSERTDGFLKILKVSQSGHLQLEIFCRSPDDFQIVPNHFGDFLEIPRQQKVVNTGRPMKVCGLQGGPWGVANCGNKWGVP